jgi:hypothetical protein
VYSNIIKKDKSKNEIDKYFSKTAMMKSATKKASRHAGRPLVI